MSYASCHDPGMDHTESPMSYQQELLPRKYTPLSVNLFMSTSSVLVNAP